jgi:hypothetical protein
MHTKTVEKLAWILIYSGLGMLVLGTFVRDASAGLGTLLIAVGALDAVAGAGLIVVRSRMKEDSADTKETR